MASIEEILKSLESVVDPNILASVESKLKDEVSNLEEKFTKAAEEKYGIAPSVVSDVEQTVRDAAPAVESLLPQAAQDAIKNLLAQVTALTAQVDALKQGNAANQTTVVMGQGEPVPHNLFLDDGSVVKNHPGLATHYSVDVPATSTSDATTVTRTVVAAYPA